MKYLFFDFDGVLHGDNMQSNLFEHSDMVSKMLIPFKDKFKIIISSSWRETYDFDILIHAFHEELHENVIGITPIFENTTGYGVRHQEILEYCKINNIKEEDWIAIDDNQTFFDKDIKNLILIDNYFGMSEIDVKRVLNFINNPNPNKFYKKTI